MGRMGHPRRRSALRAVSSSSESGGGVGSLGGILKTGRVNGCISSNGLPSEGVSRGSWPFVRSFSMCISTPFPVYWSMNDPPLVRWLGESTNSHD